MRCLLLSLFAACVASFVTGCASYAPISNEESCALQNMKLSGVTNSAGSASTYVWGANKTISTNSHESSVSCAVISSPDEKCEMRRLQEAAMPKVRYNEGYKAKRLITGAGYYLFILPGIAAKLAFDSQLDTAMSESQRIRTTGETICRLPSGQ